MAKKFNLEDYLKELETAVNIDSGSEDLDGCEKIAEHFAKLFEDKGFEVNLWKESGRHPHVEARYSGRGGDKIDFLFMGHLDTVFEKGTAKERPFSMNDGYAYGPGAADMKSGALMAMSLAEEIASQKLPLNICLAFNTDEEIGSADAIEWFRELGLRADYCFIFEPGRANGAFVKQRKGCCDYYVSFKGIASHAGVAPEKGASAITEMAKWIEALTKLSCFEKGTTLNPGIVRGGTAGNVVAENAEMLIDFRYSEVAERERVEKAFDEMKTNPQVKGVITKWERVSCSLPINPNDRSEALMNSMEKCAEELGQEKPKFVATGGASDMNYLGDLNISAIDGCGPIGIDFHSDKEYMIIDSVTERYNLLLETIKAVAAN